MSDHVRVVAALLLLAAPAVAQHAQMTASAADASRSEVSTGTQPLVASDWDKLISPGPEEFELFGVDVALSGDTIVVAAPGDGPAGAAFVFVRRPGGWVLQARLTASDGDGSDLFGSRVALAGNIAVIGAPTADLASSSSDEGAAYVFVRHGTSWIEDDKLTASDPVVSGNFGHQVSVSGTTAVVGAMGVGGSVPGAAYVFVRTATDWVEQQKLISPEPAVTGQFAGDVAVSGDTALLGAPTFGSAEPGSAHVFVRTGTSWTWQAKLAEAAGMRNFTFGHPLALEGDTAIVGAVSQAGQGKPSVFVRQGTSWSEQDKLVVLDSSLPPTNVIDVALSHGVAVVSVSQTADPFGGAAYVFRRSGTVWDQVVKLTAPDTVVGDQFGNAVALEAGVLVAGAPFSAVHAVEDAGSAHVFTLQANEGQWTDLGSGLAGSSGIPRIVGSGSLQPLTEASLALAGAKPSALCLVHASTTSVPAPFKGGTLVACPPVVSYPTTVGLDGTLLLPFRWPAGLSSGASLWFQVSIADPAALAGVALSNAVRATTP